MADIASSLDEVRDRIASAAVRAGRHPEDVGLVAVTKGFSAQHVREAAAAGQRVFGENRVQELIAKQAEFAGHELEWHFVGRLQRNKVKDLVGRVALIHSVDRLELAAEIANRFIRIPGAESGLNRPAEVLLEVNTSGEEEKGGVVVDGLLSLAESAISDLGIRVRGLMTMAPLVASPEDARPYFKKLAALLEVLRRELQDPGIQHLSMGMSQDYEVAVEEGATLVRIGEAIFGPRVRR